MVPALRTFDVRVTLQATRLTPPTVHHFTFDTYARKPRYINARAWSEAMERIPGFDDAHFVDLDLNDITRQSVAQEH